MVWIRIAIVCLVTTVGLSGLSRAHADVLYYNDFSTSPFVSPATWFGAQHGVQSNQASWSGSTTQFIGYTVVQRAGINFFTTALSIPVGNLTSVAVDTRPATFNQGGPDRLIVKIGSDWYVSDQQAPTNSTGDWVRETFDPTLTFKLAVLDCGTPSGAVCTPNTTTGPSINLPSGIVSAIGVQANWSGQNNPSSSYVLRYDNFEVDGYPLPEPATLTVLGVGAAGLGWARRRRRLA